MEIDLNDVAVIVPTFNPGDKWSAWIEGYNKQTFRPGNILIIDSTSNDNTIALSLNAGYNIKLIDPTTFNHGATRQLGIEAFPDSKIYIFLTQDAVLANEWDLYNIVNCFNDDKIGVAYGRQLPHIYSCPLGAHARQFNYSPQSTIRSMSDVPVLGIKTAFISNSFAAYRREALIAVGGFPNNTILSEDTYVAAKMLLSGWKIAYCAEAQVYHSHDYSYLQEFKRYFDIGVFHSCEPWIREKFGEAEGEGVKFVLSEVKYLLDNGRGYLLPSAFIRTCLKYIGYRLGINEKRIPIKIKKYLSMHRRFWVHKSQG